ncbi:MAG TPA: ATP-binding cassette domain-containing protein, partial [bacterium]|nr:ATP-binding cassette domain-containing protein [bacterium]
PLVELKDVTKSYQRLRPVLEKTSCRITPGEFVYVTGVSGAGKTTLFRLLIGTERPDAGQIVVNGQDVSRFTPLQWARHRRRVGVVFQDYRLLPHESVEDNVALPLRVTGVPAKPLQVHVQERLEQVGLAGRGKERVLGLSGGEKQLVGIARALVLAPALLLADEPTGNLDQAMAVRVFELLRQIHAAGCTVIVATHDLALIRAFRFRTLLIRERRLHEVRVQDASAPGPSAAGAASRPAPAP